MFTQTPPFVRRQFLYILLPLICWAFDARSQSCQVIGPVEVCDESTMHYNLVTDNIFGITDVDWNINNGTSQNPTFTDTDVHWTKEGMGMVEAVVTANGTPYTCRINVQVNPLPGNLGKLNELGSCPGNVINLGIDPCNNCQYLWSVEPGPANPGQSYNMVSAGAQASVTFDDPGEGQYCLTVVDDKGCSNSKCLDYIIYDLHPTVTVVGADVQGGEYYVCPHQPILWSTDVIAPEANYNWHVSGNGVDWDESGLNMSFEFPGAGTYTVTLTISLGDCSYSTDYIVHVSPFEPVPITCPSVVCEGDAIEYTVDAACGGSDPIWQVSSQGTLSNPTLNSATVTWDMVGSYSVGYVLYNGNCTGYCTAPSVVQVPIFPQHATMNGASTICSNGDYSYAVPLWPGATYEWAPLQINGTGSVSVASGYNANNFKITVNGFFGTVTVQVTVKHPLAGCEFTVSKVIDVFVGQLDQHLPICAGTSVNYSLMPALPSNYNVKWTLSTPTGNETLPFTTPSITIPGTYFNEGWEVAYTLNARLWTSNPNSACFISTKLYVGDAPALIDVTGEREVCLNKPYLYSIPVITLEPGDEVFWSFHENNVQTAFYDDNRFSTFHTWTSPVDPEIRVWRERTTFFVNGESKECTSPVTSIPISVLDGATLSIAGNQTPCPDGEETYTASIVGNYDYFWEVDPALGAVASGQHMPMVHIQWFSAAGPTSAIVRCRVTICDQEYTAELPVVITPFQLTLSGNPTPCQDVATPFTANANSADLYMWYIDDILVATSTTPVYSPVFSDAGVHRVRVVAVNPNGCLGMPSAMVTVNVIENPQPALAIIDGGELPCPVGTPFSVQLNIIPGVPGATYNLYLNGNFIGNGPSPFTVTQTGAYTVQTTNGVCSNTSEPYDLFYECGCCEELTPASDVTVEILTLQYDGDCGAVVFTGSITPFDQAFNRHWTITRPDKTQQHIAIDNLADLEQHLVFDQAGLYWVTLGVTEQYNDVIIHAVSREGVVYTFQDYCQMQTFLDENPTIMFVNITTEQVGIIYCPDNDTRNIVIPFQPDFNWSFDCSEDPTRYDVHVTDASDIFDDTGLEWFWTVNNGFPLLTTDDHFTIYGAPPGTSYDVCQRMVSSQYGFECTKCQTIVVPPAPTATFTISATGHCTGQSIQLIPDIDPAQVTNVMWDFGDGSTTQIFSPFKTYAHPGIYTIKLFVESLYGCLTDYSLDVEIFENHLSGEIVRIPGGCPSTGILSFVPPDPSITQYQWSRDNANLNYTTNPITVMNSGIYRVTVADGNGCTFSPMPFPLVLTDPFPFGIIGDRTVCQNISLKVNSVSGFTFTWDIAPDPNNEFPKNGTAPSFGMLPPNTYSVTVTAKNSGATCESLTDEFTIFGLPDPFNIVAGPTGCNPYSVCLDADIYDDVTWTNYANSLFNYVSDTYCANVGGTYIATYTDENGCSVSDNHVVPGGIDFSSFLSGCYKICEGEFVGLPPLNGIPGVYDSWYWEIIDADGVTVHYVPDPPPGTNSAVTPLQLKPNFKKITLHVTLNGCSAVSDTLCIETMECCPDLTASAYLGLDGGGCMLDAGSETVHHVVGHIDWPAGWHYCGNPPVIQGGFIVYTNGPYFNNPHSIGLEGFLHVTDMTDYQNGGLTGTIDLCNDLTGEICPAEFTIPYESCPEFIWCMSDMQSTINYASPNPLNWTVTLTFSFPGHYTTGTPCAVNNYNGFLRDGSNTIPLTVYYPFPGGPPPFQMNSFDYVISYQQYLQGGCVTLNYLSNCGHWCRTQYCYGENPPRPGQRDDDTQLSLLPDFVLNPNPASNTVQVMYDLAGAEVGAYLAIRNSLGQTVRALSLDSPDNMLSLDVSDWEPGIYLVTLKVDGRLMETRKLVVQH